tara:strand:+ start:2303 stop:3337 length:1035 start_codon:yes stop_codon:yes gene_type:complete
MKRPHATPGVAEFTDWLADHAPKKYALHRSYDSCGNLHIDARADHTSRTLFVAHVDTVHREGGPNKIRKTQGMWYADGACLGADDGAGCAILMHLLAASVPGYYIFTQGEERGGIGAKYLAERSPELLGEFDRAIAFDRRGIDSVITHQGWGRCCSDEFASALSGELCADGVLMYLGDDTGVYTDTAEFTDIIPECTNISVGYMNEHSDRETLDIHHFVALARAAVNIKWDALPTVRDPKEVEPLAVVDSWRTHYSTHTVTTEDEDIWLEDALMDAKRGLYHDLLDMIAEAAYPEDPDLARKFLSSRRLTDEVLEDAMEQCYLNYGGQAETVLLSLFDAAYCEL